jgi:uncharacterized damage-inducible protein DinB
METLMQLKDYFLDELNREAERSRRALEQVPDGKHDWKPHEKSMPFGYLVGMVATIPQWVAMAITKDELDLNPPDGSKFSMGDMRTSADLVQGLDKSMAAARDALQKTTDEFLATPWRLLVAGKTVMEQPRQVVLSDMLNHWVHHRGQMTVYLRLLGSKVPALYGPSADDRSFQ